MRKNINVKNSEKNYFEKEIFSPGSYWLFDSTIHVGRKISLFIFEKIFRPHLTSRTHSTQRRDRRSGGDNASGRKSGAKNIFFHNSKRYLGLI